jgi:hypothetical protein
MAGYYFIYLTFKSYFMRLRSLLFVFLVSLYFGSYAQKVTYNKRSDFLKANSVWAFGLTAGLDFNSGGPKAIHTKMFADEGCAAVADRVTGKLLFYSNGGQVWDANHGVMPNGDSLEGNTDYGRPGQNSKYSHANPNGYFFSTMQGVCIVPVFNDPNKYYLFSLSGITSGGTDLKGALFYNIIDMSLNGGLGDVVPGKKNIALDRSTLAEAMIAIPGDNCDDVWLMVHHMLDHEFRAYHITPAGIDTVPVLSTTSGKLASYILGTMGISNDRHKIVITYTNEGALIGKFDPATGKVSEAMKAISGYSAGAVFSPDDSKLYIHESRGLYQYDLSNYDSAAIWNSKTFIATGNFRAGLSLGVPRLYNDTLYLSGSHTVSRVTNPNLLGAACNYEANFMNLLPGDTSFGHMNNDVVFQIKEDDISALALDTSLCQINNFTLQAPQESEAYKWDDGTTDASRKITEPGIYWVTTQYFCYQRVDTFIVSGISMEEPIITVDVLLLGTTGTYITYQWLLNGDIIPGATQKEYTVSENGDYQVIVSNSSGCIDTSAVYKVTNAEVGIHGIYPFGTQIHVYPNPTQDMVMIKAPVSIDINLVSLEGRKMRQFIKTNQVSLQGIAAGIYFLQIYDQKGILLKVEKIIKSS